MTETETEALDPPSSGTMCFSITGEFITDVARNFVLEENWERALELLLDSITELGHERSFKVLSGEQKLVGSSNDKKGLLLEDEDPEVRRAFQRQVNEIYAGRIRTKWQGVTGWWRPCAIVTDYGPQDLGGRPYWMSAAMAEYAHPAPKKGDRQPNYRAWHYTGQNEWVACWETRLEKPDEGSHLAAAALVFESCGGRPLWVRPVIKTTAEAILEFTTFRGGLEERGHGKWYPDYEMTLLEEYGPTRIPVIERVSLPEPEPINLEALRAAVLSRVGDGDDGWMDLLAKPEGGVPYTIRVPRAPFEHWTLRGFPSSVLNNVEPWNPISPSGLRLQLDSAHHSDWMLGAGDDLNIFKAYPFPFSDPLYDAVIRGMLQVQKQFCNTQGVVLSSFGGYQSGIVVHPGPNEVVKKGQIAVIPAASPKYIRALYGAAAVITERGGSLAHLAVLACEKGHTMMQVPDARKLYPEGVHVSVDPQRGIVEVDIHMGSE